MQEFDRIEKILKFLEDVTDNISKVINESEENDRKDFGALYKKRKDKIEELNNLIKTEEGKKFIENANNNWIERINNLTLKDKKNLEKLEKLTQDKGNKLKKLIKSKSVLIYKK